LICLGIVKNEIFFYVLGCHKHKEEGEEEDWIKYWKLNEHKENITYNL
jgi:hypothetical protein